MKNRPYSNPNLYSSALCAGRGLAKALSTQPNLWLLLAGGWSALILGSWMNLTRVELMVLGVALSLPLGAEILNTAIEQAVDLVVKEFHPQARAAKDIAAGGVLVALLVALGVGLTLLWPPWAWPAQAAREIGLQPARWIPQIAGVVAAVGVSMALGRKG